MTAVEAGVTPGGVLVYGAGNTNLATLPFGTTQTLSPDAAFLVTADTVYDVASITKVAATTSVLMKLVETGDVTLDLRAADVLPELTAPGAETIRVDQMLAHAAGFCAHRDFWQRLLAGERLGATNPREALLRMVGQEPLEYEPGTRTLYSDLGFISLGFIIERITGERLDAAARRLVFEPLAMANSQFVDLLATPAVPRPQPVAPTENCPYRGLVSGEVHDDNAHAAGGICGHAGVFSTAPDLEKLARAWIAAFNGAAHSHFDRDVMRHFATTTVGPEGVRVLGFDRPAPAPGVSHAGDAWPRDGFGHTGFTGTAVWVDPPRGRYAVLLTNRVHPNRDKQGIKPFRRRVFDAVVSAT